MAGEAGALGRAFVEIHVPVEQFASRMASAGTAFASASSKMIAEAQLVSSTIQSSNTAIVTSYNQVATSAMGLLTAEELAALSSNGLALSLHEADVAARSAAAGGVLLTGSLGGVAANSQAAGAGLKSVGVGGKAAATGVTATTFSLKSLMTMAKSALPIMAAFMAVQKTLGIASGAVEEQTEFNKELYQLWTLSDLSSEGIDDLGQEIRDITYDYNVFAKDATRAMYQVYSATFFGAEATEILEQGMKAAAAGVTDVLSAVDMTTTVLNAYNMSAAESARVNDLLFTAVRFGKTTYEELAGQFGRLAGVAAPAGATLEEMAAAISTLTRQGIMTDWAVTSLRQTIMSMFRPTGALAKVIKDLGYETGRSLIQQNGFVGALKLVKERADETGTPLENLFTNVRAITAVLPLLTTASEGFALDIERMAMASGTMDIAFAKVEQSWDYRIERLKSQLNDLSISIGETLMPAVEAFLSSMAEISGWLEGLVDLTGGVGEFFSSVTGYMAAGTVVAGGLALAVWGLNKAFLALAANPVVASVLAIGAALGVVVKVMKEVGAEAKSNSRDFQEYAKWLEDIRGSGEAPEEESPPTGSSLYLGQLAEQQRAITELENYVKELAANPDLSESAELRQARIDNMQIGIDRARASMIPTEKLFADAFASEITAKLQSAITSAIVELDLENKPFSDEEKQRLRDVAIDDATMNVLAEALAGVGVQATDIMAAKYGYDAEEIRSRFPSVDMSAGTAATGGASAFDFWSQGIKEAFQAALEAVTAQNIELAQQQALPASGIAQIAGLPSAQVSDMATMPSAWDVILGMSTRVAASLAKIDPSNIEASKEAFDELGTYLEEAKYAVELYTQEGWDGVDMLEKFRDNIAALIPAESTWGMETQALIEVFKGAKDGSIIQAQALDDLIGRYASLTGWVETLSDVEKEANSEIILLIESLEDLGITAKKAGDRMIDVMAGIASGIGGLITKFGGEGAAGIGNIATSGGGFISAIGAATAVGAGPIAAVAAVVAGLDVLGTLWKELVVNPAAKAEEERREKQEESYNSVLDSATALAGALWSLAESAESVARIQDGLAQLQVNIMSSLLAFLWPLAGVLDSINGLFVIQEETIKKETEARQKLLSNLNVPIGFPINRIRYGAGTPGEPVTFNESEVGSESEETVKEILEWWEEAMEPYRNEILGMIQPIADFRDAMQQLAIDLIPSMLQIIDPILETFGWTLGEITTWMQDVFKPDFEEFADGFSAFWTEKVDPFWQDDMGPKLGEWFNRIYSWIEPVLNWLEGPFWDWLSGPVWETVQPYVDEILDMFEELGKWVADNWDDISGTLLTNLDTWLGNLVDSIKLAAEWILDLLGLESPWAEDEPSGPSEDFWNNVLDPNNPGYTPPETPSPEPEPSGPGGLTAGEIAAIIAAHGGFGGVMGSTGQWVPYSTWNGIPVELLGDGGIAMDPTLAIVGEKTGEAIIPLNQLANMLSTQPSAAGMKGFGGFGWGSGSGGNSATININLSQDRLAQIMLRKMTSANVNDNGVGFAPIRVG